MILLSSVHIQQFFVDMEKQKGSFEAFVIRFKELGVSRVYILYYYVMANIRSGGMLSTSATSVLIRKTIHLWLYRMNSYQIIKRLFRSKCMQWKSHFRLVSAVSPIQHSMHVVLCSPDHTVRSFFI